MHKKAFLKTQIQITLYKELYKEIQTYVCKKRYQKLRERNHAEYICLACNRNLGSPKEIKIQTVNNVHVHKKVSSKAPKKYNPINYMNYTLNRTE